MWVLNRLIRGKDLIESSSETAQVIAALFARAENYTCLLWYGEHRKKEHIGTGALLTHHGKQYVLTCEHVATGFLGARDAELRVGLAGQIARANIDSVVAFSCPQTDLALIGVKAIPESATPLTVDDFEHVPSFSARSPEEDFVLVGFPRDCLRTNEAGKRLAVPYLYAAIPHGGPYENGHPDPASLYLKYPDRDFAGTQLPSPPGLSGAPVLALRRVKTPEIWHAGLSKVVAVECAMFPEDPPVRYIRCAGIGKLFDWLK